MKVTTKLLSAILFAGLSGCAALVCLTACHDDRDEDAGGSMMSKHNVIFYNSVNGSGDIGYNDDIIKIEILFSMLNPHVKAVFFTPLDIGATIEEFYRIDTMTPSAGDSVLIVLNGSDYTEVSRSNKSLSTKNQLTGDEALDLRVLTFEDDGHDLPQRVYSFQIQRYGAFYVAGRLLGKKPAAVIAGMRGETQIEDAVQGFVDGYSVENPGGPIVCYLADDLSGFDSPEKAVLTCDSIIKSFPAEQFEYKADGYEQGLCFVPIAGGSNIGMYAYVHNQPSDRNIEVIGVDADYNENSSSIPFSMLTPISAILNSYLWAWNNNEEWPQWQSFGLDSEYPIEIELTSYTYPLFLLRYNPTSTSMPSEDKVLEKVIQDLTREALEKEKAYIQRKRGG